MTRLSNSELLALTMLLDYKDKFPQGGTVEEIVKEICKGNSFSSSTTSAQESIDFFNTITKMIENNPEFGQYQLVEIKKGADVAPIATFQNGDDVVVAFWGTTGADEWNDNVIGGISEDGTKYQQEAYEYIQHVVNDLGLTGITTTGHSKGANKAQYVAIMSDDVDECVCFDGQGFSVDFYTEHLFEIEKNKNKITVISSEYDVVNSMLIDIAGTRLYVDCSDVPDYYLTTDDGSKQFFYYHKPGVLLNENGELRNTDGVEPSPVSQLVYAYSTYMTNLEDKEIRNEMFGFVGETVSILLTLPDNLSAEEKISRAVEIFKDLNNSESVAGFLSYTLEFFNRENISFDDLVEILSESGIEITLTNNGTYTLLWDWALYISENTGSDKLISIFYDFSQWGKDNNCTDWLDIFNKPDSFLLDFNNAENLSILLANVFEYCEENDISYDEVLELVKGFGVESDFLDSEYAPVIWDALFDASEEMSADEFVTLINKITEWGEKKGINSWDQLINYVLDDPFRLFELYEYCGADNEAFNRAVTKLFSWDNISALLAAWAKNHPLGAEIVSAATINPFTRHFIEAIGTAVVVVSAIAMIANHIIKNWDEIVADIKQTVEEIKEKVGVFFSELIEKVKNGIEKFVTTVFAKAMQIVDTAKNVVNSVIEGTKSLLKNVKESALNAIKKVLNFSRGIIYKISSGLFGTRKEPVRVNYSRLRDCVDRMNAIASRVNTMDKRLDTLYLKLIVKDVEQESGVFTSLANMYNLIRADISVDEGWSIRCKAQAISLLFGDYNSLESQIKRCIPSVHK